MHESCSPLWRGVWRKGHDERSAERDKILAEAVAAVGQKLQALADAMNRDSV